MKLDYFKLRELFEKKKKEFGKFTTRDLYNILKSKGIQQSYETISAYRKGNIKEPDIIVLNEIAKVFNVNLFDLIINGSEYKKIFEKTLALDSNYSIIKEPVPTYTAADYLVNVKINHNLLVSAGLGNNVINEEESTYTKFDKDFLKDYYGIKNFNNVEMVRVSGDSMTPDLQDGEYIFLEKGQTPKNGDTIIARFDNQLFVKRYKLLDPIEKTWIRLESINNNDYPPIEINTPELLEAFHVVGVVRCRIKLF